MNRTIDYRQAVRFRTSGKLLAVLSIILLLTISILSVVMFSQIQSLRNNVEITENIINANIRTLGQLQRELLRLKIALIDDSDNETIDLYRAFTSQRMNEVTLSYYKNTLGADELINRANVLVSQWRTDVEPLILDVLLDATDDDTAIRNDIIVLIDEIELQFNNLASQGELNRKYQAGDANHAAQDFVSNAQYILIGLGATILGYLLFIGLAAIDYLRFDKQREMANEELRVQQARFRALLEIATQSANIEEQLQEIVEQGSTMLGMEIGLISQIRDKSYTVVSSFAPKYNISNGMKCSLDATLCKQTIQSDQVLSIPNIPNVMEIHNPCFADILPKSYIGIPIMVNQHVYGTLSFVSDHIRETAFSETDQDFVRLMGQWVNISLERQQSRDNLATYATNLEKSNTELQQFAYAASHDLQEPLRKIQTFGSRITDRYSDQLDERGKEYLARMQNAAQRMQVLIQDLLLLSRVTTQAQPLESTNLNDVIAGVLSDLEVQIEKANATITIQPLPTITADTTQMRQLFQNVISNGIKFAREGVDVQIEISGKINTLKPKAEVEICISDNGIGFEQQYAERIFSVFQRLHGRGEYEGTGVGLALCRKIVERHNGNIIAKGQLGVGAQFIITLPLDISTEKQDEQ